MARNNKRQKKQKKGSPAWMTSFADLQQLLLVFFILLFSMSVVDENKFLSAVTSIQKALNTSGLGLTDKGVKPESEIIDIDKLTSMAELKNTQVSQELKEAQEFLNNNQMDGKPLSEYVKASKSDEGVILTIKDVLLFDSGSAEIKADSISLISKMKDLINSKDRDIRIEGHTDNVPLRATSKYSDNWELSTARATSVASFMIDNNIANPNKISVAGYSEYKPVANNDTPENKSKNRRVDIVLLSDFSDVEKQYEDNNTKKDKTQEKKSENIEKK